MAKNCGVDNKWFWAEKAAQQGERDGFYELGTCYMYAYGCTKDETKAKELYLRAAKLGLIGAMTDYAWLLKTSDPERCGWLAKV
jgi:TPR repeat protein